MDVERTRTLSLNIYHIEETDYLGPIDSSYFSKIDRRLGQELLFNTVNRNHLEYTEDLDKYITASNIDYEVTYLGLTRNPLRWITSPFAVLYDFGGTVVTFGMWGIGAVKYDMRVHNQYPILEKQF